MAADNATLGVFRLEGIPAAPRGVPQVEVTFDLDANGILNVSATDKASGKSQQITITASTNLNEADVKRMVTEAEQHAAEDRRLRELIEARNMADQVVYQAEKSLNNLNGQAPDGLRQEMESKIAQLQDAVKGEDTTRIRQLTQEVQQAAMAVGQADHQAASDTHTAGTNGSGRTTEGEEIVEGEFEAV
jgi:molecular chaperone DnaK